MADQLLFLGHRALGIHPPGAAGAARYPMRLAADAASEARALAFLAERGISAFVAVNIDATDDLRSWRPERCAVFVAAVLERHPDLAIVFPPPPGKEQRAGEVVRLCGSARLAVAERFGVLELAALFRRSVAVVTPDTGAMHVAAACGRPIVALYTLRPVHVERWLPWGVPYRVVVAGAGETVSAIPPERIIAAFEDLYDTAVTPMAGRGADRAAT